MASKESIWAAKYGRDHLAAVNLRTQMAEIKKNITEELKRIQLERHRHGVNLPAFRGVLGAIESEFGAPDAMCGIRPGPASGYQAAAERVWRRDGVVIRAIFRDTTIEAFEGCLAGDPSFAGPCGLTGQLLVRISPPDGDNGACPTGYARRGGNDRTLYGAS